MTTTRYPRLGDYVAVEECEFVSGNSSVPFIVPVAAHFGTLVKTDATTYALIENNVHVAIITAVYSTCEDEYKEPYLLISGWKKDGEKLTHIRWVVTK